MEENLENKPDIRTIREAYQRICPHIHNTPVLECGGINKIVNNNLFFKCENFQKVGAFKFRGASNAIFSLTDQDAAPGVVTHSSGNHAAALALAARKRNIDAYIVMPSNAPKVKIDAVIEYGGKITFCESTLESRESTARQIMNETGACFIHPYNDLRIIAGQATAALELLEEIPNLDYILAPVSGGGLLSGTAISAKSMNPKIKVFGCEPQNADDAYQSLKAGEIIPVKNPDTIADGLRTCLGDKTFPIIHKLVDDILLVKEEEIVAAMQMIYERMKIVIEPSAAVAFAAVLFKKMNIENKKIGIILSGGNVDFGQFFNVIN